MVENSLYLRQKVLTMEKIHKKSRIFGGVALVAFAVATLVAIFGLSHTMTGIADATIQETPDAILASVGVVDGKKVALPVMYYDQKEDACVNMYDNSLRNALRNRQFEWQSCGYTGQRLEQGLVEYELGAESLPVAVGGKLTSNRGVMGENFTRWFSEVEGKSKGYAGVIEMDYKGEGTEFSFYKKQFYPLDAVEFSDGDAVNGDGHNHLFTMSFAVPFMVMADGGESFEVKADDDTFVYVGDKLVIDMGGVHATTTGKFMINENGEVYAGVENADLAYTGVQLSSDEGSMVRIFHADRDASESEFNVKFAGMNLTVESTSLASNVAGSGVQVAYDPTDSSYAVPLGVSKVVKPDGTGRLIVLATVEGVLIVVFATLTAVLARFMIRARRK